MRKWITLLMTLLVGASVSQANATTGQITLEAGYRRDNIDWRTRLPSDSPFLKTTTRFKDLDIFQIGVHGRAAIGCNFYVRANAYWGWILDGDFEQSFNTYFSPGYFSDDFEFGFKDDHCNVIDDKYVFGLGAAIGYPFYFCDCTFIVAPVIGYAFDEQNIEIDDEGFGFSTGYGFFFPVSGSECCEHKFISKWYGPFVGIDFAYRPYNECWNIWAEIEYHWGNFNGKKHVNHDEYFSFFDHCKFHSHDARGWVVSAGADYDLCGCWTIGLAVKFQDWTATRHHRRCESEFDYFYFDTCDGRERHNFKWHSGEIKIAAGREF